MEEMGNSEMRAVWSAPFFENALLLAMVCAVTLVALTVNNLTTLEGSVAC